MTSTYARESNERAGQSSNWAKDNSRVGAQIGSASTVYLDVKFYDVRSDDPPEKKYDVALKFLDGGNPRRAEELIKEAVGAGFLTDSGISGRISRNHVAYHLALAVLSGRSFSDLGPGEIASLVRAKELADRRRPDEWFDAFVVIRDLVECLERQEYSGRADPEFDRVLLAYRMLKDDARREHIQRHLDMMLAGGIADRLEEKTAEDVRNQRMSNDRKRRVPLFFEAVPEPPRPKTPEIPVLSRSARVVAACAAMVISAGLVLCVRVVLGESVLAAVVVVGLLAGGGYAAARFGLARFAARGRLADQEREYNRHYPVTRYSVAGWDRGHHEVTGNELRDAETGPAEGAKGRRRAFRRQVPRYVESQFTEHAPDRPWERRKWQADTAGIEVTLEKEILDLYSEPATEPYAVDWLIAWRVRQIARRWRDGRLHDYRDRLRVPAEATAGFVAGVAGLVLGAVIALLEMFAAQVGAALILVLVVAFGGWLLARSRIDVYLVRRRRLAADEADAGQRLRDERQEYQRWLDVLTDRPADDDMARWLDYDKSYLKKLAMNQYGLANRDVVAHAVLTEAGANASGARVTVG